MKKLVAKRPVLFRSQLFRAGDSLPADNQQMVDAWLDADSAAWEDDETEQAQEAKAEAEEKPEAEVKEPSKKKAPAKKVAKGGK